MSIEIRERTLPEKLMWYASLIDDAKTSADLMAAAIQLPALLREAADKISGFEQSHLQKEQA